jgi:hypothetical protein
LAAGPVRIASTVQPALLDIWCRVPGASTTRSPASNTSPSLCSKRAVQHQHQLVAQVLVEVAVRAGREPQQQADGVLAVAVGRPQRVVLDPGATGLDPRRPGQVAQVEPAPEYVPDDLDSGHDKCS